MIAALAARFLRETDSRILFRFLRAFAWKGALAVEAFRRRLARGEYFPAFLFLSITNRCNLECQGCWVRSDAKPQDLSLESMDRIVRECKARGVRFFGLLGGEPLMHPDLYELIGRHPDCYFQVFTNGLLLDAEAAGRFRALGNVTPLVSIEGLEAESDRRRKGAGVYRRATEALGHCREAGLIAGAATSVCRSNFEDVVDERFLDGLIERGALYAWYYIYRPAGPEPGYEEALDAERIVALRRFLVEMRPRKPIVIVDSYWDADGRALCPAATGISVHVNPFGWVEPCPPIQFARDCVREESCDVIAESEFLAGFRKAVAARTRGCILLEDPAALAGFLRVQGAEDTSGRDAYGELARMPVCASHHQPGREIAETCWPYRFAKRRWFFGFGAYG